MLSQLVCTVATSCCISDVSCQWEGGIFDPQSSEICEMYNADD